MSQPKASPKLGCVRFPQNTRQHLRRAVVVLLTLALNLVPAPVAAQAPIRVDVDLVLVEATVKNKAGGVLGELKKDDFLLYEDGAQQQVAHFSRDQLPLAVALVVDLSGSIQPFLRPLRYATLTALKTLKPEDQVALITFASEPELRVELTRDKLEVSDQIEFFSAEGSTNINDAVHEAARYLQDEAPAARRVVVLISDNVPTNPGHVAHKQVVEAALAADSAVYSLKVPGRNPQRFMLGIQVGTRGAVNVKKLTEETGGEIFDVEKEGSLFVAFQSLIERLKTRYTLGYYHTNKALDGKFRSLDVKLLPARGRKGSDYTVLAKRGYYARRTRVSNP